MDGAVRAALFGGEQGWRPGLRSIPRRGRIGEGAGAGVCIVGDSFCTSSPLIRGGTGVPVPAAEPPACAMAKSPSCTCMAQGNSPAVSFPTDPWPLQRRIHPPASLWGLTPLDHLSAKADIHVMSLRLFHRSTKRLKDGFVLQIPT